MLESIIKSTASIIEKNIYIILFYLVLIIIILIFRKRFEIESKFILLYKTKFGLKLMEKLSKNYGEIIKIVGYSSIGVGFLGMLFMIFVLIQNLISIIIKPSTTSSLTLVLPGTIIPGIGKLNFTFWLITIFVVALAHESAHGIVSLAHKIRVKSSGIVFFGPIIGAFVEPEEKEISKSKDIVQYSIFAAGPFANIILSIIIMFIISLFLNPLYIKLTTEAGISFTSIQKDFPAEKAGLKEGIIINKINNQSIKNYNDFLEFMISVKPNQTLELSSKNQTFVLVTTENPEKPGRGYIGISGIKEERVPKSNNILFLTTSWFLTLFNFIMVISAGIGLFNLLPLGIVDGGRMIKTALESIYKDKNKALNVWKRISWFVLLLLLFNLLIPAFKPIIKI
ncbi:MAG: site-2 protease family protein [Candidatus Woesearchaeota archaeon]